ncbi:hypothetical protein [Streptomyces sp. PR69]|uniref:hypothetical protein n=1 Tax=Streptomyces sp. PR69 TaxID=2984950 RepID=UPI0022641D1F|nr:hypothetical protein [Streptomyces sp. PR69]
MTLPHQPPSAPPPARRPESGQIPEPETRRRMVLRRLLTLVIILLLIGVPAGYLVVSAQQSRASGRDKEAESSATGLREVWPSLMKRRIFEVPIPSGSAHVAYYETSNWKTSRLYVQFRTSPQGLDAFLKDVGTSRAELADGEVAISDRDAETVGWDFDVPGHDWRGIVQEQQAPRPTRDITVDLTEPDRPWVYVVSATNP